MAVIEIEEFALRTGVTPEEFLVLDEKCQLWSYVNRRGLVRRTTAVTATRWAVVTWWANESAAAVDDDAECRRSWLGAIDTDSLQSRSYTTLD